LPIYPPPCPFILHLAHLSSILPIYPHHFAHLSFPSSPHYHFSFFSTSPFINFFHFPFPFPFHLSPLLFLFLQHTHCSVYMCVFVCDRYRPCWSPLTWPYTAASGEDGWEYVCACVQTCECAWQDGNLISDVSLVGT